jgi:hypothetical protein
MKAITLERMRQQQEPKRQQQEPRLPQRQEPKLQRQQGLLQVQEQGLAEELYQQIREGESDFADLAAVHSLGREAQSRGQFGPEPLGDQHPELASRLRSGHPGQLWPPFEVETIWVVLRLETAALSVLDEPLRQRLQQELMEAWMQERTRQILSGEPLPPLPLPKGMEVAT